MPSKSGVRKPRRSRSTSSSRSPRRKAKRAPTKEAKGGQGRQSSKNEGRRRRRSSSTEISRRRPVSSGSSSRSDSKPRKKFKPKNRSKSPGKAVPAVTERKSFDETKAARKPFSGSAAAEAEKAAKAANAKSALKAADASPPATGSPTSGEEKPAVKKLDLGTLLEFQKKLEADRDQIGKAKQEHEEQRETKEKYEQREREYFKAELGMPCGPDNRILLEAELGKGVFSTVYMGKDMGHKGKDFAIKFIRSDPMCRRATEKEVKLMRKLRNQASVSDPEGARCLLGLAGMEMFEHQGHLAVVLQLMKCDLRSGLRKYGQGNGLPLPFVLLFARDIFLALRALRSIKVVHTDLKPDNLLISLDRTSVRLSDFGSAMDISQAGQVHTDYLQPRYYRAPEVMIGHLFTTQIDMWSAGATVYELATDRQLFRGDTNNGMIHAMLKVCGPMSKTVATSGKFSSKHFNDNGDFLLKEKGSSSVETLPMSRFAKPSPTILQLLEEAVVRQAAAEFGRDAEARVKAEAKGKASMRQLADLISKCCMLDPNERATPKVALAHPFVVKAEKTETAKAFG